MKVTISFFTFFAAALVAHAETAVTGIQHGRPLKGGRDKSQQIEKLAEALLVSSDYEAAKSIATQARWQEALQVSHVRVAFSEPHTFSIRSSTIGPARLRVVSVSEILIPISHERSPDYVLVRLHDHVRAFAKFSCDANTALQNAL